MIRVLAQNDPTRLDVIARTVRVRDGLEAYLALCREVAQAAFDRDQDHFIQGAHGKNAKAPRRPAILEPRKKRRPRQRRGYQPVEKPAFMTAMENQQREQRAQKEEEA